MTQLQDHNYLKVKAKLIATLKTQNKNEQGQTVIVLKNSKIAKIKKAFNQYILDIDDKRLSNNLSLDGLAHLIIKNAKK